MSRTEFPAAQKRKKLLAWIVAPVVQLWSRYLVRDRSIQKPSLVKKAFASSLSVLSRRAIIVLERYRF
jgi:hypothetical protein